MSNQTPVGSDIRWRLTPTKIIVAILLLIGIIVPLLPFYAQSFDARVRPAIGVPTTMSSWPV